jgi:mannose-6-phosphate isomerase
MDGPLCPLRFAPIFKPALWGGRRLGHLLRRHDLPDGPVGEAWVLSDCGGHVSHVCGGPFDGATLRDLLERHGRRVVGRPLAAGERFPLLLKFLDARDTLSVQVHPDDEKARPLQSRGKTEAWVILESEPGSRLYAGLRPGIGPECVRQALAGGSVPECLHSFEARPGDCVFLPAGVVHAIGAGLVLFEVQQTSDLTYRLHDWDRIDAVTGRPRPLHIDDALACTDFDRGPSEPVRPVVEAGGPARRERLVACDHFQLWRWRATRPFTAGAAGTCRVLVGADGRATVHARGGEEPLGPGDVMLLPAELGPVLVVPEEAARPVTVLECGLPDEAQQQREAA